MLWIPIVFWLVSPDRTTALGTPGWMLIILTVVIQFVAILLAFVIQGIANGWEERQARVAGLVLGWVGYLAGFAWAWWASFSLLELSEANLIFFVAFCMVYLVPVIVPIAKFTVRRTIASVVASLAVIASGVLTAERLSPILIAPVTVYVLAITVSGVCAVYAKRAT